MQKWLLNYYKGVLLPKLAKGLCEYYKVDVDVKDVEKRLLKALTNSDSVRDFTDSEMRLFIKKIRMKSAREYGILLPLIKEPEYEGLFMKDKPTDEPDILKHEEIYVNILNKRISDT